MLGDDRGAVGGDLGDREPRSGEVGDLAAVEERVVAAGGLGAALDDVTGGRGAGERVEVVAAPAEVADGRPDDDRGVGDATGDDDVRARVQACLLYTSPSPRDRG